VSGTAGVPPVSLPKSGRDARGPSAGPPYGSVTHAKLAASFGEPAPP
jgi:hypothetical protein